MPTRTLKPGHKAGLSPLPTAAGLRWLRFVPILLLLLLSFLLGGCVQAELGVEFYGTAGGRITEHLKLSERAAALSNVDRLLANLQAQARSAGGDSRRVGAHELSLSLPFGQGRDLQLKLEQLLNSTLSGLTDMAGGAQPTAAPAPVRTHLNLRTANWLLATANHLELDLDLRSLGVAAPDGALLLTAGQLVDLEVSLSTPLGARSPQQRNASLVWTLTPGIVNHIEADFWLPNPLGIGAVGIAAVVGAGYLLKYRVLSKTLTA